MAVVVVYFPGTHAEQMDALAALATPRAQVAQTVNPGLSVNFPAAQEVQTVKLVLEPYVPDGHAMQVERPVVGA